MYKIILGIMVAFLFTACDYDTSDIEIFEDGSYESPYLIDSVGNELHILRYYNNYLSVDLNKNCEIEIITSYDNYDSFDFNDNILTLIGYDTNLVVDELTIRFLVDEDYITTIELDTYDRAVANVTVTCPTN